MTEDVVADLTGRFVLGRRGGTPSDGRIILTDQRVVLATNDGKTTVPLPAIVDVNVGSVPKQIEQFFDDTVTIGYEDDGRIRSAVIESESDAVATFVGCLFRCVLNGLTVGVKHPARVGGRVKETSVVPGTLRIEDRAIEVTAETGACRIDVENVMNIDRTNAIGDGDDRATLVVKHIDESGLTETSLIAPAKRQCVNLLARYLRLEFDELREEVEGIELTNPEKRVLVGVHATGGTIDFTTMLDGDPAYVTNVLNSVRNKELIVERGNDIALTPKGRIVVSQRIEDVNA